MGAFVGCILIAGMILLVVSLDFDSRMDILNKNIKRIASVLEKNQNCK